MYLINFRHDCMWSGRCNKCCSDVPNVPSNNNDHTYSSSSPIRSIKSDSISEPSEPEPSKPGPSEPSEGLRSSERLKLERLKLERLRLKRLRVRKLRELIKISRFSSKNIALSVPITKGGARQNHNELERQRRQNLTNLFNDLKHELELSQSYISSNYNSKINILRQATVCCTNLVLRDKLINENKILKNKLLQLVRNSTKLIN